MIQRKQTLFLLLALVLAVVTLCLPVARLVPTGMDVSSQVYNLWIWQGEGQRDFSVWPLFLVLLLTCPVTLAAVLTYRKRALQARLCVVSMLLLVAWYILFLVILVFGKQAAMAATLEFCWPLAMPAVSIILHFMARQGILADEKLVRSMDRIR